MLRRHLIAACMLLLFSMFISTNAIAQESIFKSNAEQVAFNEVSNNHFIKARKLAEDIIKESPDSIGANYVLAYVFWEGEGNLIRATQYLKKTLSLFKAEYCKDAEIPSSNTMQSFHQRILRDLAQLYAELDQRENEIKVHEEIARIYKTPLSEDAVWALLKLDRIDEAYEISNRTIRDNDRFFVSQAYNNRTATADAEHKHAKSLQYSEESVKYAAGKSCVVLLNHARAHSVLMRLDKAVEFYIKSMQHTERDCVTHPLTDLSSIYLIDGAWQRAISAMLNARKRHVEKRLVVQVEKHERTNIAEILFAMGFTERAWHLMKTVVEAPGRLGYDSLLKEQVQLFNSLEFYAMSVDMERRIAEHIAAWTKLEPFWLFKKETRSQIRSLMNERQTVLQKLWSTHQKLYKQALNPKTLRSLIVPFYVISPIYNYIVPDAIGRRTTEYLIENQIKSLEPEALPPMQPVFDLLYAYIYWRDGNDVKALSFLDKFDNNIPEQTKLLVQQSKLIRADIMLKNNNTKDAYQKISEVYKAYPALFRHYNVKLPISFSKESSWDTDSDFNNIRDAIKSSSFFQEAENAPFSITAARIDKFIQLCITSSFGTQHTCSSINPNDYSITSDKTIHPAEIINNFYHVAFAPNVDMTQADLHSLDGSTTQVSADKALEKLLSTTPQTDTSIYDDFLKDIQEEENTKEE